MKIMIRSLLLSLLSIAFLQHTKAQGDWEIPVDAANKLSITLYDEDMQNEGKLLYSSSCVSCHGTPGQGNFTTMFPSPGDLAGDKIKQQRDGELFYKIQKGRGVMPSFENAVGEQDIWNLIAYIRSFDSEYKQQMPDMAGIHIPELSLQTGYDENIDKLVIKVFSDSVNILSGAMVKAFVKGMFGNHYLGSAETNQLGIAYINVDSKLPGDAEGNITVIVKAVKGYGSTKSEQIIKAGLPTISKSATEGRHLWSKASKAPYWMIISFNIIGISIWMVIIYIIFGLRNIKKLQ